MSRPQFRRRATARLNRLALASLGLLAGLAAGAAPAAGALTLDDALQLAQQRSRQLPAQELVADAALQRAQAARQRPDPVLKLGISNLPIDGADRFSLTRDFMTMRTIGLMQEFTRSGKRQARAALFEREADVATAGRRLALADLQRDTAASWLERHYRERIRDLLVERRAEARLQVDAADATYRGGRGSQADAFEARAAVALIDDRIVQAEQQAATAKTLLARWIGAPAAAEPLAAPPALGRVDFSPADLEAGLTHHPEIALLLGREEAAQADVELARAARQADPSVEVMVSQRGPAYSNMVSINLALPLQWDQRERQDREVAARLATVGQRRAEREEAVRMHVAEALAWWQEWQGLHERLARYDSALLPLAAERTRAALAAYRGGAAPLAGVLESRRGEIDVRLERLRLELEAARLWARLNYLLPAGAHAMPAGNGERPTATTGSQR